MKTVTQNASFQKRFSEWRFWKTLKTEVFEYDDVVHHILLALRIHCQGCYRVSIDSSTLRVDFFENGGKNVCLSKIIRILVDGGLRIQHPAPLQALILDISQPIHTRAIKFTLLYFTFLFFSFLYFTFDVANAPKGDGTLVVVSRSYAVVEYKPTLL